MNTIKLFFAIIFSFLLALTTLAAAQGRIVVSHDVNTLATQYGGPQEQQFAVNVAEFLTDKSGRNILAIVSNPTDIKRDYAQGVKAALAEAGFNVTYSYTSDFSLAQLQTHDAVFVGIIWPPPYTVIDNSILTEYVNSGGNVYIFGGSGSEPDSSREASLLNPFLKNFGLAFDSTRYNQLRNYDVHITSIHLIFKGVTALRADNGHAIIDLGTDSRAQIVQFEENQGIYAVFDGGSPTQTLVFLPRVYGLPGDTINVTLYADPVAGISGGDFVVHFDSEVLTALDAHTTDFTHGFLVAANLDTPGIARLSIAGAHGITGGLGGLVTIKMAVNSVLSVPDTIFSLPLRLESAALYDENGQPLPITINDGMFILGANRGDVNGDGLITSADAILALRVAAGLLHPTPEQFAAADFDGNGHVESFDASCILRRAVGLDCPIGGHSLLAANLEFSPFSTNAGNEVETQVVVNGIDKILSADVTLQFETSALEIIEIRPSTDMVGVAFVANLASSGRATFSLASTNGFQSQALAVVRLRAKIQIDERNLHFSVATLFDDRGLRWNGVITAVKKPEPSHLPMAFRLEQNYPNPFYRGRSASRVAGSTVDPRLTRTAITYSLPRDENVRLVIYDLHGRRVRMLEAAGKTTGQYVQIWDGFDDSGNPVATGVYVYRLQVGRNALTRKLLLLE